MISILVLTTLALLLPLKGMAQASPPAHARARALGVAPGTLEPGAANSITDVAGVGRSNHCGPGSFGATGITAILPHQGNLFLDRVPAAIVVNGFGKLLGSTQVNELGELETPVLLTCTLCVWKAADAMVEFLLERPGMTDVRSINPVVGETNDGYVLNAIRSRPIVRGDVRGSYQHLERGRGGECRSRRRDCRLWLEGRDRHLFPSRCRFGQSLDGGGAGTVQLWRRPPHSRCSRRARVEPPRSQAPEASRKEGRFHHDRGGDRRPSFGPKSSPARGPGADWSRPNRLLDGQRVGRLRDRLLHQPRGLVPSGELRRNSAQLANDAMSGLFQAVAEATEEAIYNSLFMATTVSSNRGTVEALPVAEVIRLLRARGLIGGFAVAVKASDHFSVVADAYALEYGRLTRTSCSPSWPEQPAGMIWLARPRCGEAGRPASRSPGISGG